MSPTASSRQADYRARNTRFEGLATHFDAFRRDEPLGSFVVHMPGAHNVLNALSVIAVADELEVPLDVTREAIAAFHGVQRRFTVLGTPSLKKGGKEGDVMIVDDYGHHPAEIEATLDAAQRGFDRRVVVAFQPHRYTRTKLLFDEFTRAFNKADVLVVTDVYAAGETPIEGATGEALAGGDPRPRSSRGDLRPRQEASRAGAPRRRRTGRHRHRARRGRHQRERARAIDDALAQGGSVTPGNRRVRMPELVPAPEMAPAPVRIPSRWLAALRTTAGVVLVVSAALSVAWAARRHVMTSPRFAVTDDRRRRR